MTYVVYQVTCSANGKRYVGYTSKTAEERFEQHLLNARWKRKTALYDAIRCYGPSAFSVEVLQLCRDHQHACEVEVACIVSSGSLLPDGYNMTHGGDGVPLTREQIDSANAKKRGKSSDKQKAAALRRRGSKASPETRAKLSVAQRGKKHSEEWVFKQIATFKKNRDAKVAAGLLPVPAHRNPSPGRGKGRIVWTPERREAERQRAMRQWTPEAKAAAKERAARQWNPEAREAASARRLAYFRRRAGEQQ
jgi:group I intron endonuclease